MRILRVLCVCSASFAAQQNLMSLASAAPISNSPAPPAALDISSFVMSGDKEAAAILRGLLERTGAYAPKEGAGVIEVLEDANLPLETMRVRVADTKVTIAGNPARWAVYEFLGQKLGARFLWPGRIGTYVPRLERIVISRGDLDFRPSLLRRDFRQAGKPVEVLEWTDKHYLSKQRTPKDLTWGHAFHDWYAKYGKTKPELFALNPQGKVVVWANDPTRAKLRISSPVVLEAIKAEWIGKGAPDYICLSPTDSAGYDTSDASMALDPAPYSKEEVWAGKVNLTDRHVKYWNTVLTELRRTNPKLCVAIYAYAAYRTPPKTVRLEPDSYYVQLVPSWYEEDRLNWDGWGGQAKAMFLRPNWPWNGGSSPFYPLHKIGAFIEFAYANKMQGFDMDSLTGFFGMRGPFYYLIVRKMAHPEIPTDAIIDEFVSAFGAAKEDIRAYIQYWEDYSEKLGMPSSAGGGQGGDPNGLYVTTLEREKLSVNPLAGSWWMMPYLYTDEVIQPAMDILQRAREKASGEDRERVQYLIDAYVPYRKQRELISVVIDYCFRSKRPELLPRIEQLSREFTDAHKKMYGASAFGSPLVKWVKNANQNLQGM